MRLTDEYRKDFIADIKSKGNAEIRRRKRERTALICCFAVILAVTAVLAGIILGNADAFPANSGHETSEYVEDSMEYPVGTISQEAISSEASSDSYAPDETTEEGN